MSATPPRDDAAAPPVPDVVDVYADVVCPFAYVGLRRLVDRRSALGQSRPLLRVRAWPLELVNGAPLAATTAAADIEALRRAVAPELFRGFDPNTWPLTSLPALALAAHAAHVDAATGERVNLALRAALFERGVDISMPRHLDAIAHEYGLPYPDAADRAEVIAELEHGRALGVPGSPTFVLDGELHFCPSLDIHHDDDGLQIALDRAGFAAVTRRLFGPD